MSNHGLSASEAAERLGVSTKALRLYEQRGLVTPRRTAAGYRAYGPDEMHSSFGDCRAACAWPQPRPGGSECWKATLKVFESALAAHEASLEREIRELVGSIDKVRGIRAGLARGQVPAAGELARLRNASAEFSTAFDLPWPWGGERFELRDIRPINYIIGPLGSGKTRLAMRLAEVLPNAAFLGLERVQRR